MIPSDEFLCRLSDNKTRFGADIHCKWKPISLQGQHFTTTIFCIPDGSNLTFRLRRHHFLLSRFFNCDASPSYATPKPNCEGLTKTIIEKGRNRWEL